MLAGIRKRTGSLLSVAALPVSLGLGLVLAACDRSPAADALPAASSEQAQRSATPAPQAVPPGVAEVSAKEAAGTGPCDAICARSRELACPRSAECPVSCAAMVRDAVCRNETLAALRCFVSQPASRWECGDDGMAAIRDGHCDQEQGRVVQCLTTAAAAAP